VTTSLLQRQRGIFVASAGLLGLVLSVGAVAVPAYAEDVAVTDIGQLSDALLNPSADVVSVNATITQATTNVATNHDLTLELNDKTLWVGNLTVGAGTTLTIRSTGGAGHLSAYGQGSLAGITTNAATIVIESGTVSALSDNAAGIGGDNISGRRDGGSINITGGTVAADAGKRAAAIGGASTGGAIVTIEGGNVTARGLDNGPGIGGGANGVAGFLDISILGGNVTATGGVGDNQGIVTGGPGIGGGDGSVGGTIAIIEGAHVTAKGGTSGVTAVGSGTATGSTTVYVGGRLTLPTNAVLKTSAASLVSVDTTGLIDGPGTIIGSGTLENLGSIQTSIASGITVTGNNFPVSFIGGDGSTTVNTRIYAATFGGSAQSPPSLTKTGFARLSWNLASTLDGEQFTAGYDVAGYFANAQPPASVLDVYAVWGYPNIALVEPQSTVVAGSTVDFVVEARDFDGVTPLATLASGFSLQSWWNIASPDDVDGSSITFSNPGERDLELHLDADPNVSAHYSIVVVAGPVVAIDVQAPSAVIKGSAATFSATGVDANEYDTPAPAVTYSTVPATSTIDGNVITFNEATQYRVTAVTADSVSSFVDVEVGEATFTGVAVTPGASTVAFGQSLTASATGVPVGASVGYQWYRGTTAIQGATNAKYTAALADVNSSLRVSAKITAVGYFDFETGLSSPVAVHAAALGATSIAVTGAGAFGKKLTATTTGTAGTAVAVKWYRAGTSAAIGSGSSYTVTAADVAGAITARAVISKAGFVSVTKTSKSLSIAKDAAKLTAKLPASFKKKKKTTITVTLARGASVIPATGSVRVYYGSKYVTVKYTATTKSTVKVVLPKLKKGTYKVYAKYLGSAKYATVSTPVKTIKAK